MITIRDILRARPAERQYDILQRADHLFQDRCGRYYGGILTNQEIDILDPEYLARQALNST